MSAANRCFFDDGNGNLAEALARLRVIGEQLHQPVCAGQPGSTAANDRNTNLDPLTVAVERAFDELPLRVDRRRIGRGSAAGGRL